MGTNYYFQKRPPCKKCGREYPRIHIGKSSNCWHFALRIYPEMAINSLKDWKRIWRRNGKIFDEYDKEISWKEMESIITERSYDRREDPTPFWLKENSAKMGYKGLLMHDCFNMCGNEGGTWDLLQGEFS